MRVKEPRVITFLKLLLLVLFIISIFIIGLYPFPNQNLLLVIKTDAGEIRQILTSDEIREKAISTNDDALSIDIKWQSLEPSELKEIDIYRYFKSIILIKYNGKETQYYYSDDNGIHFTNDGIQQLYETSQSLLLERIVCAEALVAVAIFFWILINALHEKLSSEKHDNHGPIYEISNFIRNLNKYREYMFYAAKANLNAEVANSYLNRLWWILEPFCNMMVYVLIFGHVMGSNIERYATFVFSALIMWNYFSHIINYSVKCVRFNKDIITKIYVPKYILLLTNMVLNFMKLLFSITVLVIMLFVFHVHVDITILWVIPAYILMFVLSFGIGMIFLHYGVFIDDLAYAVSILLSMLMFLSGIFYDVVTGLSAPLKYFLMSLNPVIIFVEAMRNALLFNRVSNVPLVCIWLVLSFLISYIGVHIVNKSENGYVKVI